MLVKAPLVLVARKDFPANNEIRAWMGVVVEGNQTREVIASLLGDPGVAALHDTSGRWDLLAELRTESNQALSKVLERVRLIKGIRGTETSILLASCRQKRRRDRRKASCKSSTPGRPVPRCRSSG